MVSFKGIFRKMSTSDTVQRRNSVDNSKGETKQETTKLKKKLRRLSSKKSVSKDEKKGEETKESNGKKFNEASNRDPALEKEVEQDTEPSDEEVEEDVEEYEEEGEGDEEDDPLGVQFENPEEHYLHSSSSRNEFKTLTTEEIIGEQQKVVVDVADLLQVPPSTAAILLRHFQWKRERLVEQYFQNPDGVCRQAGIVIENAPAESAKPSETIELSGEERMCSICFMETPGEECTALKCSHCFCNDCWKNYLTIKITEGEVSKIKCPDKNCNIVVDEHSVKKLVDEDVYDKYLRFITKSFVEDSDGRIKWCPQPNCGIAITADMITGTVVKCRCGHRFCFSCHREAHLPASCDEVRSWVKKCKDDSETSHWKYANTKDCPKCESPVEKNGGCNHMTCRQCKHEWCWVCIRPWKGHNDYYNCNKFLKPEKKKSSFFTRAKKKERLREREAERERNRVALERYLHFFERYMNHSHSSELEKQIRNRALTKVAELQNEAALNSEVQYILDGTEELLECRNALKYTYVFAYYMPESGPEKELFEFLQEDLEKCTEDLSEVLELSSTSPSYRLKAMNAIHLAQTRKTNLLQAIEQGLTDNL